MQRVGTNRNPALDKFGAGKHGFTAGNPQTGTPATTPGSEWFDAIQEELANAVEGSGLALDVTDKAQLLSAIKRIAWGGTGTARPTTLAGYSITDALALKQTSLGAADNWNTLTDTGVFSQHGGTLGTNAPVGAYGYGTLLVLEAVEGLGVNQLYLTHSGQMFFRGGYVNGSWNPWRQTAVKDEATPTGEVAWFAMPSAPTGWLKCNGAVVSRTTYAELFAAIGTTFGAGDGSTTFTLPDLRGEFVRGWDDGRGVDTGRTLGSAQAEDFKSHAHQEYAGGNSGGTSLAYVGSSSTATSVVWLNIMTGNTGGSETRPRNVALLPCIKF